MTETLFIERTFAAPPAGLFAAFTDPAVMARWYAPGDLESLGCEADPRPGGRWRFSNAFARRRGNMSSSVNSAYSIRRTGWCSRICGKTATAPRRW